MKRIQNFILRALICGGCCMAVSNIAAAGDFKPLLRMNLDSGGDELLTVIYEDGDTSDIKAGQLFTVSGGVLYKPQNQNYILEATLGYKFDKVNASNGSAEFTRLPLDFIASYKRGEHRFGGGITYHLNPELTCDITSVCSGTAAFSDALGFIAQYAYSFQLGGEKAIDAGVRLTAISYEVNNGGDNISGNSFGAFVGFVF